MAPGTKKAVVAKDIARLTRSISRLKSLGDEFGAGLIWGYASLESGGHISYPGHGEYPTDCNPAMDAFDELKGQGPSLGFDDAVEYDSFLRLSEP